MTITVAVILYLLGVALVTDELDNRTHAKELGRSFVGGLLWPLWALVALGDGVRRAYRVFVRIITSSPPSVVPDATKKGGENA